MDIPNILVGFLDIVKYVIFAHFIMSWLITFGVLNVYQPIVGQIWGILQRLLEPIYGPIRSVLPNIGGMDLSPLVALFAVIILQGFLSGL